MIWNRLIRQSSDLAASTELISEVISWRVKSQVSMTEQDWINEAKYADIPLQNLLALKRKESTQAWDAEGRLTIAYETHVFARNTGHRFNSSHPHLSTRRWVDVRKLPKGVPHAYRRNNRERWMLVAEAMSLDGKAGLMAGSYGPFQILGENYASLGFNSPQEMVEHLYKGERENLEVALRFIRSRDIMEAFQKGDWELFARRYNGSGQIEDYSRSIAQYAEDFRAKLENRGLA